MSQPYTAWYSMSQPCNMQTRSKPAACMQPCHSRWCHVSVAGSGRSRWRGLRSVRGLGAADFVRWHRDLRVGLRRGSAALHRCVAHGHHRMGPADALQWLALGEILGDPTLAESWDSDNSDNQRERWLERWVERHEKDILTYCLTINVMCQEKSRTEKGLDHVGPQYEQSFSSKCVRRQNGQNGSLSSTMALQ